MAIRLEGNTLVKFSALGPEEAFAYKNKIYTFPSEEEAKECFDRLVETQNFNDPLYIAMLTLAVLSSD